MARGWSFFGQVAVAEAAAAPAQRAAQAMHDPDATNRFLAFRGA